VASRDWLRSPARNPQHNPSELLYNLLAVGLYTPIMELPSPVPDELVELIARRFRLLSEPMRIRLFDRLRDGEATVHELADELGSSQQNVSKHLTLLADAGVLARRKEGTSVYYRLADEYVLALCEQVCGSVEQHLLDLAALVAPPVTAQPERSLR
jgi:DNA-binding transcriptional ArsR family regulator